MANVTQWLTYLNTTSKQGQSALAVRRLRSAHTRQLVVPRTRTKYGDQSIAVQEPPISGTVYLLSCELQTGSEIINGECDAVTE